MNAPFLHGDLVSLRPLFHTDIGSTRYLSWLNDYEVTKYLGGVGVFPENDDSMERFFNDVVNSPDNVVMGIVDKSDDSHIGNIKLGPISWLHRRAELSIMIGEKDRWGKGFGTEATRLMVQYGFNRLNLHKITLGLFKEQFAGAKVYEKIGFEQEGVIKESHFIDGKWNDRIIMGILQKRFSC